MFNCAFRYVFVDLVFYKGLKLIPYCVDVIVVFLYECIKSSNDFSSLMLKHCSIQYTNFPFTALCLVKQNSLFTLFSHIVSKIENTSAHLTTGARSYIFTSPGMY